MVPLEWYWMPLDSQNRCHRKHLLSLRVVLSSRVILSSVIREVLWFIDFTELADSRVSEGGEPAAGLCACLNGDDRRVVCEIEIKKDNIESGSNHVVTENRTPRYRKLHHWAVIPMYTPHFPCLLTENTTCSQHSSRLECISTKAKPFADISVMFVEVATTSNCPITRWKRAGRVRNASIRGSNPHWTRDEIELCQPLYYIRLHS